MSVAFEAHGERVPNRGLTTKVAVASATARSRTVGAANHARAARARWSRALSVITKCTKCAPTATPTARLAGRRARSVAARKGESAEPPGRRGVSTWPWVGVMGWEGSSARLRVTAKGTPPVLGRHATWSGHDQHDTGHQREHQHQGTQLLAVHWWCTRELSARPMSSAEINAASLDVSVSASDAARQQQRDRDDPAEQATRAADGRSHPRGGVRATVKRERGPPSPVAVPPTPVATPAPRKAPARRGGVPARLTLDRGGQTVRRHRSTGRAGSSGTAVSTSRPSGVARHPRDGDRAGSPCQLTADRSRHTTKVYSSGTIRTSSASGSRAGSTRPPPARNSAKPMPVVP